METFTTKILQRGPIVTVHVIDSEGTLDVSIGEDLETVLGNAITKMYARKVTSNPALELLKELVETADVDKVYDRAEMLVKGLV